MAEKENSGEKNEIKKPGTPKFGKPRIVVPQASREAARSNMAGEAMAKSSSIAEPEPVIQVPEGYSKNEVYSSEDRGGESEKDKPNPEATIHKTPPPVIEGRKPRGSGKKGSTKVDNQPEETKNVRLLNSLWLNAKFNLVQLNGSKGPTNLTDYAEEAFKLYEKHLLKIGMITRTRTD